MDVTAFSFVQTTPGTLPGKKTVQRVDKDPVST
jgi:hypothetical protein